ncbi:BNR repeat domain protein [Minicystis rosea]|nr:BNR repeat domain protein [Minicystis rosea]
MGSCQSNCGQLTACSGMCVDTSNDPQHCGECGKACAAGEYCAMGSCQSNCGQLTACSGMCVDTNNDPKNCGECGKACAAGEYCAMGSCQSNCGQLTACSGMCVDTDNDPKNCGACGKACAAGQSCGGGNCLSAPCGPGQTTCGSGLAQHCAKIATDPQNCGGCGFVCPTGKVCSAGQCGLHCTGKTSTLCGGGCVDILSDNENCGACGNACPAGQVCSGGTCAATCASNYTTCGAGSDAHCANVYDDPQNCGACGSVCPAGQLCAGGTCASFCSGALDTACNGLCVNPHADNQNCGACGNVCPSGQVCSGGACAASCATGYASCGTGASAYCAGLSDDPLNCGSCGHACPVGQGCSQGVCAAACTGINGTLCGGLCTNLTTDPQNCGSCGYACAAGQVCSGGGCTATCAGGQLTCTVGATKLCTDGSIDPNNCGGCGKACPAGQVCSNGACAAVCATAYATCGTGATTYCTNIAGDPNNCGACGNACKPPVQGSATSCNNGACGYTCLPGYAPVNNNNQCLVLTGISAGRYHTCGVTAAGGVMCWGYNGNGQLGNGTTNSSNVPVTVLGLAGTVTKVAVGAQTSCALLTNGSVQCWGQGTHGELGNGANANSITPVSVTNLGNAVDVQSGGNNFSCALTQAGAVVCWGVNDHGQLGNGTMANSALPVPVSNLGTGGTAIAVGKDDGSVGGQHVCAITMGKAYCWGYGTNGQLGTNVAADSSVPVPVLGLSNGSPNVVALAAGAYHTCAITDAGAVSCWGYNAYGQLGDGTTTGSLVPMGVSTLNGGVKAIAAGSYHTCVFTQTKSLLCWGRNDYGQLGNGTTDQKTAPTLISPPAGQTFPNVVSMGTYNTFGATASGALYAWGINANGQLGDGTTTNRSLPTPIK